MLICKKNYFDQRIYFQFTHTRNYLIKLVIIKSDFGDTGRFRRSYFTVLNLEVWNK